MIAHLAKTILALSLLLVGSFSGMIANAQSTGTEPEKAISDMSAEELEAYIKEQEIQLEAVKQARDAQKAKFEQVQEALLERQEKLNEIVIELSELCAQRKALKPSDKDPCLPEDS